MLDPVITLLAALCGALLFGSAAEHKWRGYGEFVASVGEYRLLPEALAPVAACVLAAIESIVCLLLLCFFDGGWYWQSFGALLGAELLSFYALAMSINLARGRRDLDCDCGIVRKTISGSMVMRNLMFATLVALAAIPASERILGFADYATVVGGLAVCALLYASAELLLGRAVPGRSLAEMS